MICPLRAHCTIVTASRTTAPASSFVAGDSGDVGSMAVGVWPNEFKHLDEWIDRVIAGLPSEFEIPLPSLELVNDEWQRRRLRRSDRRSSEGLLRAP